jgi:hypothetical protein
VIQTKVGIVLAKVAAHVGGEVKVRDKAAGKANSGRVQDPAKANETATMTALRIGEIRIRTPRTIHNGTETMMAPQIGEIGIRTPPTGIAAAVAKAEIRDEVPIRVGTTTGAAMMAEDKTSPVVRLRLSNSRLSNSRLRSSPLPSNRLRNNPLL